MGRAGLSPESILETIHELDSEGADVTVTAVRERLGTGSYTTIGAVLSEWRRQQSSGQPGVPEPPATLRPLAQRIWSEAWKAAQAALHAERQSYSQERATLQREKEEMRSEIARLEKEAAKLTEARDRALQAAEEASAGANALQLECSKLRQANEILAGEVDRLRADAQKASDAIAGWIERATRAEARLEQVDRRPSAG